jgi:hypothetical protein
MSKRIPKHAPDLTTKGTTSPMGTRTTDRLTPSDVLTRGDGFHGDGKSLYLRVDNGGRRRSWVFRYARDGKVRSIGIGAAPRPPKEEAPSKSAKREAEKHALKEAEESLKQARGDRDRLAKLIKNGKDPLIERERAAEARSIVEHLPLRSRFAEGAMALGAPDGDRQQRR